MSILEKIFCKHNQGMRTLYTFEDKGWKKTVYVRECKKCGKRWFFHRLDDFYIQTNSYVSGMLYGYKDTEDKHVKTNDSSWSEF